MLATRILKQEGFLLGAAEGKPLARLWKQLFPRAGKETA
jgi:hypothetical protein